MLFYRGPTIRTNLNSDFKNPLYRSWTVFPLPVPVFTFGGATGAKMATRFATFSEDEI